MYPISGTWETRQSGVTTIKKDWADATDASINGIYGGTKTIKTLQVDGIGYQNTINAPGSILASGDISSAHTVNANESFYCNSARSSATPGAGQSVSAGQIFNDT